MSKPKGQKIGRDAKKPSHMRYVAEGRAFKNKKRRAQRLANRLGQPVRIRDGSEWVDIKPNKEVASVRKKGRR